MRSHTHTHTQITATPGIEHAPCRLGATQKKKCQLCEKVHAEIQQETHTHTQRELLLTLTLILKIHRISCAQGGKKEGKTPSKASVRKSERRFRLQTCGVELNKKNGKNGGESTA